jgi:hypothetical protein
MVLQRRLAQHNIPVMLHTFEGGHRLDDDILQTVVANAQ